MKVLVTSSAGYVSSYTLVELINAGQQVLVLDNYYNSSVESLKRVQQITGQAVQWIQGDIRDAALCSGLIQMDTSMRDYRLSLV